MADSEHIADLLFRHLRGELTSEEQRRELEQWREANPANEELFNRANDKETLLKWLQQYHHDREEIWQKVVALAPELQTIPVKKIWWKYPLAAAFVLAIIGSGIYWMFFRQPNAPVNTTRIDIKNAPDIPPGTQKAILTLADGSQINLDSMPKQIPLQVNQTVIQSDSGLAYYHQKESVETRGNNTLTTPRGGQYFVVLSDGTRVWLNAASRLNYPIIFPQNERRVELTGEGYFEVAKNKERPFKININNKAELTVLGTHFDVAAYDEDQLIKASLLEGSIRFQNKILQPGQQAQLSSKGTIRITAFNEKEVMGWKTGMVQLNNAEVESILKVVSRWYDVDVVYQGKIPEQKITGGIPRNVPLSEVIKVLNLYNIDCHIEGKQLIVN